MALNLFKKQDRQDKKEEIKKEDVTPDVSGGEIKGDWSAGTSEVLRGFYVSEKAYSLTGFNQYVFKVRDSANKPEIKKQVEKIFSVKVKNVKVVNSPDKERNVGRHSGVKSGFKKAIVVLKEGYSIDQAK